MANRLKQEIIDRVIDKSDEMFEDFSQLDGAFDVTVGSETVDKLSIQEALNRGLSFLNQLSAQDLLAMTVIMGALAEIGDDEISDDGNVGVLFEQIEV